MTTLSLKAPIRRSLMLWLTVAAFLGAMALGCFAAARYVYYRDRFYPDTRIEGMEVSLLTAEEAAEKLDKALSSRMITVLGEDGVAARIPCGRFQAGDDNLSAEIAALLLRQHREISYFSGMRGAASQYSLQWMEKGDILPLLQEAIGSYGLRQESSARLVRGDDGWSILPSSLGSFPLTEDCAEELSALLRSGSVLSPGAEPLTAALALQWIEPKVPSDDPLLNRRLEALEKGTSIELWLDFGDGMKVQLSRGRLAKVFAVRDTEAGEELLLSELALRRELEELIEELGADGVPRKLGVLDREEVHESDWDAGFLLDRELLLSQTAEALRAGGGTVVASYDYTSSADRAFGVGDTYIEVSILNQTLWVYQKGQLMLTTPVRTGDIATNKGTRPGLFQVSYKQENAYLSRYNYRVRYWIPFDGHIGIHDADWVEAFGGDIYLTDGSHGCVNVPPEVAGIIFENCEKGSWVLVY